jgi:type IV fimbrial biogenesis protein FimT
MTTMTGRIIRREAQPRFGSRMPVKGFTLVELMIVMIILGVILAIGLPGFATLTLSTKLKSYANEMVASVYLARSEAIKLNKPMRLCVSADGIICAGSGDWEQGWIVIDPSDNTVIGQQPKLSAGYKFTGTGPAIMTFLPSGVASDASTMKVCRLTPEVGGQEREVIVSITGRPRVTRTETSTCP